MAASSRGTVRSIILRLASIFVLAMGTAPGADAAPAQPPAAAPPAPAPPAPTTPEAGSASAETATAAAATTAALVATEPVLVEACDGSRTAAKEDPRTLGCNRWTIAWREGGTAWGFITADSYDAVIAERERQLAFARRHARFFGVPLDERYTDPSEPICETCRAQAPAGRWGAGQKFGDEGAREALAGAETELQTLHQALQEHMPRLEDAARLAREPATSRAARAYAKQLRHGVLDLAKARLALDNATVFRSEPMALDTGKAIRERIEALGASHAALGEAVARVVAKAHGGKYTEEGSPTPDAPALEISVEGTKVVATYFAGGGQSTWFEGAVELDGGIAGRSLVAPDSGQLTCQQHSEACGYVYIDSVLRFTEREDPDQTTRSVAELWFRRDRWVMAKPFVR